MTSQDLVYNSSTQTLSINSAVNWDANCVLTGGTCAATGATMDGARFGQPADPFLETQHGIPFQCPA